MSIPTWNGYAEPEVAATTINAATPGGILLTFSPGNNNKAAGSKLAPCTHVNDPVDAILISEVVSDADYKDQYYIYKDIDFSAYTKIGEPSLVLKGFKGLTMCSLALVAPGAPAPAGTELIIDAATSKLKVRPGGDTTSPTIAVCIDALGATDTQTGAVHMV